VEVVRTAKLKLNCSSEQVAELQAVTAAFRDGQNFCSRWAFDNGKTTSNKAIHQACYSQLRERFGLSAQLACTVERQVASTYRTLWTATTQAASRRKSAALRKAGGGKGRLPRLYRGLDSAPVFRKPTAEMLFGRDYSFKKGQQVSVSGLNGRVVIGFEGWERHVELLADPGIEIGSAKLWYQKSRKQWYLLVSFTVTQPDPKAEDLKQVVGVDVGQRYHAVTRVIDLSPEGQGGAVQMHDGTSHRRRADHYQHLRTKLQAQGTRSSKRRLALISGRERRFTAQRNHVLARTIIDAHPQALIGMEELAHIRERVEPRSSKQASDKRKRSNRVRSTWSYAELRSFVTYKAPLSGSLVVAVDPSYTSQTCPRCLHVSRENRIGGGEVFHCVSCSYLGHADVVGATNVGLRAWRMKEEALSGCLSATPSLGDQAEDVSCGEAEAGRKVGAHRVRAKRPELKLSGDANL